MAKVYSVELQSTNRSITKAKTPPEKKKAPAETVIGSSPKQTTSSRAPAKSVIEIAPTENMVTKIDPTENTPTRPKRNMEKLELEPRTKKMASASEGSGYRTSMVVVFQKPIPTPSIIIPAGQTPAEISRRMSTDSWVAFRLASHVEHGVQGVIDDATDQGINIRQSSFKNGRAMNNLLQPGKAQRKMYCEEDFHGLAKDYMRQICKMIDPCLEEALAVVNPDVGMKHELNSWVLLCQEAKSTTGDSVIEQHMHNDVGKVND